MTVSIPRTNRHGAIVRGARGALVVVATAAALAAARPALAQGDASTVRDRRVAVADSLIEVALERARAADTSAALQALQRATTIAPSHAPAFYQYAVMLTHAVRLRLNLLDNERRSEASRALKRALELDPGNPRYILQVGLLRLRTPLGRLDAERQFDKALRAAEKRHDPVVLAAVHLELGQLYERRYHTTADRALVDPNTPFSTTAALADPNYVRDFLAERTHPVPGAGELDLRKAESHYRDALAADPTSEDAAAGLFGLLADARRYEEILRATDELRVAQPRSPRRLMARGLALHRLGRSADAERDFDSALALLPPATRSEMTSLGTILRRRAAAAYDSLSDEARARLDSLYWDTADPLILAPGNEARAEYFARLAYADLRFSSAEFGHQGWRTDRGIVYERYGPPTRIATFMAEDASGTSGYDPGNESGAATYAVNDPTGSIARITTVWWWKRTNVAIVFTGPPAMNTAWYADDFRSYAASVRETQPVHLEDPAALPIDSVGVQVARFRPEAGAAHAPGDVDVAIFADVPTGKLLKDVDIARAPVVTAFVLRTRDGRAVASTQDSLLPGESITTRTWRAVLPRGEYGYRVEALQPASGKAARAFALFDASTIPDSGLALSDMLVARGIVPRSTTARPRGRSDFEIAPNGGLTFRRGDSIYVYWEEYGLTPDPTTGAGRSRVEFSLHLDAIDRTGRFVAMRVLGGIGDMAQVTPEGDDRVSLRYERTVPLAGVDRAPSFLGIALGDAPYGRYTLELTVTDLVTGRVARRQRVLYVPRP